MISKLPISYAALPLPPIELGRRRTLEAPKAHRSPEADRTLQTLKITAWAVITAILILGFLLPIQGVGHEDHGGVGPDRPPLIVRPAPAPPPSYGSLELTRG